ncbi:TetR family transcriptional regulator C-terminal domain-containing protein [Agrobacterium cavarae]|uniref:TetR family transcriptional regulator C-terminal domain-containing protein n=1 Tax=Agrobacterium cavarae TaxID=2528239 RepID=UPI003FD31F7A
MARESFKERIAEAALDTLHRRGFNATGIQEIADAAGVPKGSFYNHFASKEAAGVEALERYWISGLHLLEILSDIREQALQRLRTYFARLREIAAERNYNTGCLIGNFSIEMADHSPAIGAQLHKLLAKWTAALEACIRDGQEDGSIKADLDPSMMASFVLNSWQGAVLRARADKNGSSFAAFDAIMFAVLRA